MNLQNPDLNKKTESFVCESVDADSITSLRNHSINEYTESIRQIQTSKLNLSV